MLQTCLSVVTAEPQAIKDVLWAFATMGVHPGDTFLAAMVAAAQASWDSFEAQHISIMLWALAKLGRAPGWGAQQDKMS